MKKSTAVGHVNEDDVEGIAGYKGDSLSLNDSVSGHRLEFHPISAEPVALV